MSNRNGRRRPSKPAQSARNQDDGVDTEFKEVKDQASVKPRRMTSMTRGFLLILAFAILGLALFLIQAQEVEADEGVAVFVDDNTVVVAEPVEMSWGDRWKLAQEIMTGGDLKEVVSRIDADLTAREHAVVLASQDLLREREEVNEAVAAARVEREEVEAEKSDFNLKIAGLEACLDQYLGE